MAGDRPELRQRTMYYFRIQYDDGLAALYPEPFQNYVEASHEILANTEDRTFAANDGKEVLGIKFKGDTFRLGENDTPVHLFHICIYEPDSEANLVSKPSADDAESGLDTQSPEDGWEFIEGDLFGLIYNNHMLVCPSGIKATQAGHYLKHVLSCNGHDDLAYGFDIQQIADLSKIAMIEREGVSKIEFDASNFNESYNYLIEHQRQPSRIMGIVKDTFEKVFDQFCEDTPLDDIYEQEILNARFSLHFDGRKNGQEAVAAERNFKSIATRLVEDENTSGYTIFTKRGNKIRGGELVLTKKVGIPKYGKSVDRVTAWNELGFLLQEFHRNGALEQ